MRNGLGDGDAASGAYDPGDPAGNVAARGDLADLVTAADARDAALTNVDTLTALQSKLAGVVPKGAGLPLALVGAGLLVLLLVPDSGGGRRR